MTISIDTLKTLLKINGLTNIGLSDDELQVLLDYKISELEGLLGVNIYETLKTQTVYQFKDDRISLTNYPVASIESITLDNGELDEECYVCDADIGVIYFTEKYYGILSVYYISCLPVKDVETIIEPLLIDMIQYSILNSKNPGQGVISSIKEGDVSVNYDTSTSLGNRIYTRIDELRKKYTITTRIRLI